MTNFADLATNRIEHLVERAVYHANLDDDLTKELLLVEAKIQATAMDGAEDLVFMRYHRYASDSFGVVFELNHGDAELMFGGV
jgi:hypothetical protein